MSPRELELDAFLQQRNAKYVSAARIVAAARTLILEVPVERIRDVATTDGTSPRQLAYLRSALEQKFGLRVLIAIQRSTEFSDLESGLNAMMLRRYPGLVRQVVASFPSGISTEIAVFLRDTTDDLQANAMRKFATDYMADAGLALISIELVGPAQAPASTMAILRSVKKLAPVHLSRLAAELGSRGLTCPSERWLSSRLDTARKRGLVVRSEDGAYSLTSTGLATVPFGRSRTSSDIERMLSVARRKEW